MSKGQAEGADQAQRFTFDDIMDNLESLITKMKAKKFGDNVVKATCLRLLDSESCKVENAHNHAYAGTTEENKFFSKLHEQGHFKSYLEALSSKIDDTPDAGVNKAFVDAERLLDTHYKKELQKTIGESFGRSVYIGTTDPQITLGSNLGSYLTSFLTDPNDLVSLRWTNKAVADASRQALIEFKNWQSLVRTEVPSTRGK